MDASGSLDHVLRVIASLRAPLAAHGVVRIGVFGSVARGTATPASDVDLLVELDPQRDLLDPLAVKRVVSEALGRAVDVVSPRGVRPRMREEILREVRHAT